jgi:hypothetical protein
VIAAMARFAPPFCARAVDGAAASTQNDAAAIRNAAVRGHVRAALAIDPITSRIAFPSSTRLSVCNVRHARVRVCRETVETA